MGLNPQKGNMYGFVTHTWNTVKGKCLHDCSYCYMKRFGELKPVRFDEKELKTDLGVHNFIFVGSSCDMFALNISPDSIKRTLIHCSLYNNRYLFQSKNPGNFLNFIFPEKTTLCTTIETNRKYDNNLASDVMERAQKLNQICGLKTMVTIEPIMDFDLLEMVDLIKLANPDSINIGAMTGGHKFPEPSKEKVLELIEALSDFKIHNKSNLKRILKDAM